jgi:hypothetical protein
MEPNTGEGPKISRGFLLGILRAALRPSRVDLAEVKKVLRVIVVQGYDPVAMYREAVKDRPENYEPVPLLPSLLPPQLPREVQLDLRLGNVLRQHSSASKSEPPEPEKPS